MYLYERMMLKSRIIWLAVLSAPLFSIQSSHAQGGPRSGLYQITSGRYTECCGIAGALIYSLPSTNQQFVELTVDPQRGVAQMRFLAQDRDTVFRILPNEPVSGFAFAFSNGIVVADLIEFREPMPPPGSDQPYFNYTVRSLTDTLWINGTVITPCPGCDDFFTQFEHTNMVAVLMPTGAKPRLSLSFASTNDVIGIIVWNGQQGQTNIIEASTDLITWTPVSTNVFPSTACPVCPFIDFRDPESANLAHRFYRSFSLP